MIELGFRTPSVKDLTKEEKMQLAKELGMHAVELGSPDIKTDADANEWKQLKEKYALRIDSLGLGLNLCDLEKKEDNRKKLLDAIPKAKTIGISIIFTRTMEPPAGIPQKETWQNCINMTRECVEICEQNGLKFAIEVDPPCFVDNLERVEYLIAQVNHPGLYLNYDPTNFYVKGSNYITVIDRLKDKFIGGHIKDAVYRTDYKGEVKVGEGEVDYHEIFRKLIEENIPLTMYIEHCKAAQQVIDAHKHIAEVLKTL